MVVFLVVHLSWAKINVICGIEVARGIGRFGRKNPSLKKERRRRMTGFAGQLKPNALLE